MKISKTKKKNIIQNKNKCSLTEHSENDAIVYCQECKVYMCNKCEKLHSGFLKNHHLYNLDKNSNEIFTGMCTEANHSMNLVFYCQTHNQLCCAACIAKIKCKGIGQHKHCKVYYISKIKNRKKKKLQENITNLEELSNKLEPSINELKTIFIEINESKEKLKIEVQKVFTKIRNELNNREDVLFLEIDKIYKDYFFNEEFVKESEKLPDLAKICLEKGKIKENEWEDESKLSLLINNYINIENTIKDINLIYNKITMYNSNKEIEFEFNPKDDKMLEEIKKYGNIKRIDINMNPINPINVQMNL